MGWPVAASQNRAMFSPSPSIPTSTIFPSGWIEVAEMWI
jgi:hypothetical protein